ncbi:Lsr2 family protein [Nocardia farcinica]|jgi:hypothetical protein|uniref:histone-like nucleoid-structuring protein Lsr2 n=1 Tax=Nocardia farcinica TaxID=37329 RepID=UPI0018941536|nr:Lsr2 family protein [Nocardia farcinica]MBF6393829.1 Lsr2 family protein [Nocardia farcinica]MBF6411289.1 Lsr2 family protein [Nocardia farcinica]MCZ9330264.1 Lsr2 family protein [Nocardia farcinica]UEX26187.1 Lsr2 family protein [Nocardia farcinica]
MAKRQRLVVDMTDDLTGETIPEGQGGTVTFGYAGTNYELELSDENRKQLEALLQPYRDAARVVKATAPKRARSGEPDAATIRKWARERGIDVPARGRIHPDIVAAYKARDKQEPATGEDGQHHSQERVHG